MYISYTRRMAALNEAIDIYNKPWSKRQWYNGICTTLRCILDVNTEVGALPCDLIREIFNMDCKYAVIHYNAIDDKHGYWWPEHKEEEPDFNRVKYLEYLKTIQ